jgi:NADPH-dependent 7-cyano-7-deazaguanine reductase QueF
MNMGSLLENGRIKIIFYDTVESIDPEVTKFGGYSTPSEVYFNVEYRYNKERTEDEAKQDVLYTWLSNFAEIELSLATYDSMIDN